MEYNVAVDLQCNAIRFYFAIIIIYLSLHVLDVLGVSMAFRTKARSIIVS